jgi:hypothetical protein
MVSIFSRDSLTTKLSTRSNRSKVPGHAIRGNPPCSSHFSFSSILNQRPGRHGPTFYKRLVYIQSFFSHSFLLSCLILFLFLFPFVKLSMPTLHTSYSKSLFSLSIYLSAHPLTPFLPHSPLVRSRLWVSFPLSSDFCMRQFLLLTQAFF